MSKVIVFATVDRPNKPPMRHSVFTFQRKRRMEGDLVIEEETDYVEPNRAGLYIWRDDHPYHEIRLRAMKAKMDRENKPGQPPRLIGPFTDTDESGAFKQALAAVQEVRPKTAEEEASVLRAKLSASEKSQEAEREKLEKEIADLKKMLKERAQK